MTVYAVPDATTWTDSTGRTWTAHGADVTVDDSLNVQGAGVVVEMAFGYAPLASTKVWTDVTERMRSLSFQRGRQFELNRVEAGTGDATLDNRDGELTPGNTASAWYPNVVTSTPVRLTAIYNETAYVQFEGTVEDVAVTVPGKVDVVVDVSFVDAFDILAAAKASAVFGDVAASLVPRAYWAFSDTSDSGPEGDHTLTLTTPPTTGATGAWTGDEAYDFDAGSSEYVTVADGAADLDITGDLTVVGVVDMDSSGGVLISRADGSDRTYSLTVTPTLTFLYWRNSGAGNSLVQWLTPALSGWVTVAVTRDTASGVADLYIDGVAQAQQTFTPATIHSSSSATVIGQYSGAFYDGAVSEVALFDRVLTADEVAAFASATQPTLPEQLTSARVAALLDQVGVTGYSVETGLSTMTQQAAGGVGASVLEEIGKATDTEAGTFFVARDGTATFQNRHFRIGATSQATFGPSDLTFHDVEVGLYKAQIYNSVTVTPDGGLPVRVQDATSITSHGERPYGVTTYPANADEAKSHAAYLVYVYKENSLRAARIVFYMGKDTALWPVVLAADIGDRFTVQKTMPGDDIDQDVFLEAITHDVSSEKTWTVTWDLSPASPQADFWVLEDAVYGLLGSTTILAY